MELFSIRIQRTFQLVSTVLNPAKQKMLFSIRKQPSGYGVRIADISGKISSSVQREL